MSKYPAGTFALIVLLALPGGVSAQNNGPGTTAANFLKLGASARAVSMGDAFTAIADDVNSIHYNPAGLGTLERQELSVMYNRYVNGVTQQWGAYAFPTRRWGTLGLGFNMLKVDPFPSFDNADVRTGDIDASDIAAMAAYSKELGQLKRISIGFGGKYIRSKLAGRKATAIAFDAGILARYGRQGVYESQHHLGAAIRNVGSEMRFINEAFPLPRSLHFAAARLAPFPHPFEDVRYVITAEFVVPNDNTPHMKGGVEIRIVRELALRAGFTQNQDAGLGVSAGLGFTSLNKGFTVAWFPEMSMDYAFVDLGNLETAHRLSFSVRFGYNKNAKQEYESLFEPRY